jgi:hypothetical protein
MLSEALRNAQLQIAEQPAVPVPAEFPQPPVPTPRDRVEAVLRLPDIELTPEESARVQSFQEARLLLGSAASTVMVCSIECGRIVQCPLAAINKAPAGHKCPLEVHYAKERFLAWADELEVPADQLSESERIAISQLVAIDVQEQRCLDIVAIGEDAKYTQKSVKDVDQNGNELAWEYVIHQNMQLIEVLQNRRRTILRDWELTPEMKSKKNRGIVKAVADLASRTADTHDRIRGAIKRKNIVELLPNQTD